MNNPIRQVIRMLLAGILGTVVAILAVRRFETWFAGLLGLPIALLLSDIRRSIALIAEVTGYDGIRNIIKKIDAHTRTDEPHEGVRKTAVALFYAMPVILFFLCWIMLLEFLHPLKVHEPLYQIIGVYAILFGTPVAVGYCSIFAIHFLESMYRGTSMTKFPLVQLLSWFDVFRSKSTTSDHHGFYRCCDGPLVTWREVGRAFRLQILGTVGAISICWIAALLFLIVIIGMVITLGLKLFTNRSTSAAAGVIVGFTVDYIWGPATLMSTQGATWFIGCSVLGGASGIVIWMIRASLAEVRLPWRAPEPAT